MTARTIYTCDGCGATAEEPSGCSPTNWATPYFPGYGYKCFCTGCSPRVALYGDRLSCPSPEVEAACAPLREGLEQSERQLEESRRSTKAEIEAAKVRIEALKLQVADTNEENARLCKVIEEAREANEAMQHRAEIAEERETRLLHEVASLKADHEYDEDVNRALVLEILNMLGKKAQKRNKKRLREIRLAVAVDVGDDEVTS